MREFLIELQACDRLTNRFRLWRLHAGRDLFGLWHARVSFGRIGCDGRTIRYDFADEAGVSRSVRTCLLRRRRARKQAGAAYRTLQASPSARTLLEELGMDDASSAGRTASDA